MKLKTFLLMYAIFMIMLNIVCLVGSAFLMKMSTKLKKGIDGSVSYSATKDEFNFMKSTLILIGFCQLIIIVSISVKYLKFVIPISGIVFIALIIMVYATFETTEENGEYKLSDKLQDSNVFMVASFILVLNYAINTVFIAYILYNVVYADKPVGELPVNPYLGNTLLGGSTEDKYQRLVEHREIIIETLPPEKRPPPLQL